MNIGGTRDRDFVGVLKGTLLNATVVGVGDDDIVDGDLTCAEVENRQCLPYIDVITELIFLIDIYTPHDVDQDADIRN